MRKKPSSFVQLCNSSNHQDSIKKAIKKSRSITVQQTVNASTCLRCTQPTESTEVQIDIVATRDSSEVTLLHTDFANDGNDAGFKSTTGGWNFFLANLNSFIEDGDDLRTGTWSGTVTKKAG